MKLILVRHGQTDYNRQHIMQGQEIDVSLNDTGRAQVEETAKHLPEHVDRILSSPLKRTRETAEILNRKYGLEIEFRDDLKEMKYGTLAGKTMAEIEQETGEPNAVEREVSATFDYRKWGGESGEELKQRLQKCIDELVVLHPGETILIAAHGGIIAAMHMLLHQGLKGEGMNGSIHVFDL